MIHVALLRGINVGGANRVPMADLRRIVGGLGYRDVATYINSGNVVFDADRSDHIEMAEEIEAAIAADVGVRCRVLVRSGGDILAIAQAIPQDWGKERRADVVYLLDGLDPAEVAESMKPREGIDHVRYAPGALLWMVERKDINRNGLMRLVGTAYYKQATIRNVNTARKLGGLVADRG